MSEIPKLAVSDRDNCFVIRGELRCLTETEALEIIRIVEAHPKENRIADIARTLFFGFEDFLGTDAVGERADSFYETIEQLKQALKEKP